MHSIFFRRLTYNRKRTILSSTVYLGLFCALNFLFFLTSFFFSHIYLYSDGFNNDSVYSTQAFQNVVPKRVQDQINKEDCSLLYDIHREFQGNKISYNGYIDKTTLKSRNGLYISDRVFYSLDNFKIKDDALDKFAISSNHSLETIEFEGVTYPVKGSLCVNPSWNTKKVLDANGISEDISVTLIVDSEKDSSGHYSGFNSTIIKGYNKLLDINSANLDSRLGSQLNQNSKNGYDVFLPLIYTGFLIPFSFCSLAFTIIISNLQKDNIRERVVFRAFGKKKKSSFNRLFLERLLERLIAFVIAFVPFFFICYFAYHFSIGSTLLYSLIVFVYALIVILFKTLSEVKKVYSGKEEKRL